MARASGASARVLDPPFRVVNRVRAQRVVIRSARIARATQRTRKGVSVKHSRFVTGLSAIGVAAALAFAAPATARTAWSVSIGGPGYVVSAGAPAYYGPRHWHRA